MENMSELLTAVGAVLLFAALAIPPVIVFALLVLLVPFICGMKDGEEGHRQHDFFRGPRRWAYNLGGRYVLWRVKRAQPAIRRRDDRVRENGNTWE